MEVICSIGPASYDKKVLKKMAMAGMDYVRLNFSHGSHAEYKRVIEDVRALNEELNLEIKILQDLQGPKIRVGEITPASLNIEKDEEVYFSVDIDESINAPVRVIPVQYSGFVDDLEVGEKVFVDDGQLQFEVIGFDDGMVKCRALNEWVLKSNKGINLPNTNISLPPVTEKDKKDIKFGLEMGVDVISLSFVRSKHCIEELKEFVAENVVDVEPLIMAKIERPEAVKNLDDILDRVEMVMVARGDLGIEIGLENLGQTQDLIVEKSLKRGLKVFPATHFLKNMIDSPTPSRAEAVDIYHAMLKGATGVLLSNETSVGRYPVECVEFLNKFHY